MTISRGLRTCRRSALLWMGLSGLVYSQDPAGGLRGVVRDADLGAPVPAASVQIVERNLRVTTGEDGGYFFSELPPGSLTLMVSKSGYERALRPGVEIRSGQMAELDILLTGEVSEMDEMVVRDIVMKDSATEVGLLNLRESSVTMQDSISGDLLRRAGASDAAGALKLVVGASIEDGKYATVRGLSDRYVGASLNGIRIPSADPKRRAVHMDLFPAGTLKSLSVSKTYAP
ncbi:MAG: carboxypeptidase regulatory-like domain-containing protein, partial [Kiritimatiellia bacterium]|nr:carboxypeptidase regulatory-like domain-containing protein [Kiritimatiellia bacterium]